MTKRKVTVPCSKCNKTEPKEKYYPYCCAEHWGIAVRAEPKWDVILTVKIRLGRLRKDIINVIVVRMVIINDYSYRSR